MLMRTEILLHLPQMPNFRKLHVARELRMALKISVCLTGLRERKGGEKSEGMTGEKGERKGIRTVSSLFLEIET